MTRGHHANVGETRIAPNGYQYTKTIDRGWVGTGRLAAEKKLGRTLRNNERIKFIDGDKLNFDPDNIEVYQAKNPNPKAKLARLEAKLEEVLADIRQCKEDIKAYEANKLVKK